MHFILRLSCTKLSLGLRLLLICMYFFPMIILVIILHDTQNMELPRIIIHDFCFRLLRRRMKDEVLTVT